jgi:hypothetical protein
MNKETKQIAKKLFQREYDDAIRCNSKKYHSWVTKRFILKEAIKTALNYAAFIEEQKESALREYNRFLDEENEKIAFDIAAKKDNERFLLSDEYINEKKKIGTIVSHCRKYCGKKNTQEKNLESLLLHIDSISYIQNYSGEFRYTFKYHCTVLNHPTLRQAGITYKKDELKGMKITFDNVQ